MSSLSTSYVKGHPAGWLFPDLRPFWDTTSPEMPYADCNWATTTDASVRKEPIMATTTKTAKTTANTTKETAVKKTAEKKLTKEEKKALALAARQKEIDDLKAKYDEPAFETAINVRSVLRAAYLTEKTGEEKTPAAIYIHPLDHEYLCWYANERGWTNNGFMTAKQVVDCHGTIPEGVEGVTLHGPTCMPVDYYYVDDLDWEYGEPVYDDESEAIYKAREKTRRQQRQATQADRKVRELQRGIKRGSVKLHAVIDGIEYVGTADEIKAIKQALSA